MDFSCGESWNRGRNDKLMESNKEKSKGVREWIIREINERGSII